MARWEACGFELKPLIRHARALQAVEVLLRSGRLVVANEAFSAQEEQRAQETNNAAAALSASVAFDLSRAVMDHVAAEWQPNHVLAWTDRALSALDTMDRTRMSDDCKQVASSTRSELLNQWRWAQSWEADEVAAGQPDAACRQSSRCWLQTSRTRSRNAGRRQRVDR